MDLSSGPGRTLATAGLWGRLPRQVTQMSASCSRDPAVAGIEFRARANSRNSRSLGAAAKEDHADVCTLLMDPEAAGVQFAQAKISLHVPNNSRCSRNI